MARAATADEKTLMRGRGQWSQLFLAVLQPASIYTARLNGVPATTDMVASISFDAGVGTLANVLADMTLYVGTSAGAYDLGMVRIRKTAIAGTFYIGEQSHVDWQDDAYLTVVRDFDLWAKHIHMSGSTPLMDYDVAYSDQHNNFNPVPAMGSHRVAKLTGATVVVQLGPETGYSAWVFGSTISTRLWSCATAVSFSSTSAERPTATFDSVGWHAVYCLFTAANGKTKKGIRWVYIWDDDNMPASVFELRDWTEDIENGGVSFSVQMADEASLQEIRERALCILFSVDHYDTDETSIGPLAGAENIRAVGRIMGETIEYDAETGNVSFEAEGHQQWFRKIGAFPTGLELSASPAAWTDMSSLTVDRALWHLLEWRTTATVIMDIVLTDDAKLARELISPASNLWSQMDEVAFTSILANPAVDQYGRLFVSPDPQIIPDADRAAAVVTVMELTKDDIRSGVSLEKQLVPSVSKIDLSGINVDSEGVALSYFSFAPGRVFGEYGDPEIIDRLLLDGQTQANELAALVYAWRVNPYPMISVSLLANNPMVSCIPNQYVEFTTLAGDSPRNEAITKNFIPRSRQMNYDAQSGLIDYELDMEAETKASDTVSVDGDVPGAGDDFDSTLPPIPAFFPPLPSFPIILPIDISAGTVGVSKVIVHDPTYGLIYSANFNAASPAWSTINAGLTAAQYQGINLIVVTPAGGIYVAKQAIDYSGFHGAPFLAYAASPGATFTILETVATITAKHGGGLQFLSALGVDPLSGLVAYVIGSDAPITKIYTGTGVSFAAGATITNHNVSSLAGAGDLSYGFGNWRLTGWSDAGGQTSRYWKINSSGSAVVSAADLSEIYMGFHTPAGSTGTIFHQGRNDDQLTYSLSNFASFVTVTTADLVPAAQSGPQNIDSDPTGFYLMARWDLGGGERGKSSDGGATWSGLGSLPYTNAYCFEYCEGVGVASHWIAAYSVIRYTEDFGTTWINKEGNITSIVPFPLINLVLKVG
jgi:hypothetical protein